MRSALFHVRAQFAAPRKALVRDEVPPYLRCPVTSDSFRNCSTTIACRNSVRAASLYLISSRGICLGGLDMEGDPLDDCRAARDHRRRRNHRRSLVPPSAKEMKARCCITRPSSANADALTKTSFGAVASQTGGGMRRGLSREPHPAHPDIHPDHWSVRRSADSLSRHETCLQADSCGNDR